jgi:hypothetical protein
VSVESHFDFEDVNLSKNFFLLHALFSILKIKDKGFILAHSFGGFSS